LQDSPAAAFRPVSVVFGDFVPPAQDDPGDISSNNPGEPRATFADSPRKPVDKPDRKLSSADDNRGDVVSGKWPDCKLTVEGDKDQAKTLADSRDNGDPSSGVSVRERKVCIPSGGVAAAPLVVRFWLKETSSLCADCRLQKSSDFQLGIGMSAF
jgi:hypothetical protein